MNTASTAKIDPQRLAAAWDWVLRLREDHVGEDELVAWLLWYESDPANKDAYDEAQGLWQQAPRLMQAPDPLPDVAWRRPSSLDFPERRGRRRIWGMALAASLCALAMTLALLQAPDESHRLLAAIGVQGPAAEPSVPLVEESVLPDGSRVQLATRSSISMEFSEHERRLRMSSGVAFFKVAHNRERPFIVKVGKVDVRAVGTAFNIRNADDRVIVTVTEGSVDVYEGDAPGNNDRTHIAAGTELIWTRDQAQPTISAVDPAHALAWREGRLDYVDEPLAAAIADINRYSKHRVIVRDEAVGRIHVTGSVRTDATDEWLHALPELYSVEVLRDSAGDIVLVKSRKST